jgi:hypothetical protein
MSKNFIFALFMTLSLLLNLNIQSIDAKGVNSLAEINIERAKKIALEQINGKIISAKTEVDDGKTKYEIIVQAKNGRYEVEIDKATGKVLEVEKEGTNDDDDRHDDDRHDDDRHDDDRHDDDDDRYDD